MLTTKHNNSRSDRPTTTNPPLVQQPLFTSDCTRRSFTFAPTGAMLKWTLALAPFDHCASDFFCLVFKITRKGRKGILALAHCCLCITNRSEIREFGVGLPIDHDLKFGQGNQPIQWPSPNFNRQILFSTFYCISFQIPDIHFKQHLVDNEITFNTNYNLTRAKV